MLLRLARIKITIRMMHCDIRFAGQIGCLIKHMYSQRIDSVQGHIDSRIRVGLRDVPGRTMEPLCELSKIDFVTISHLLDSPSAFGHTPAVHCSVASAPCGDECAVR